MDDGNRWGRQGVVISPGGGGNESRGASSHRIVHYEKAGYHGSKMVCLLIYEPCVEAERMPGMIRIVRWWYQDMVNETDEYTEILRNLT